MDRTTNDGKRQEPRSFFRRFAFAIDEAVWQLALVTVVVAALIDGALSIGGGSGTIA